MVLTGVSMGAELGLNSANTLQRFGALSLIGELVSEGMIRELSSMFPVAICSRPESWFYLLPNDLDRTVGMQRN